ncbi:rCG57013 [Rattus norvegicus]|uniref:RCG57013 n=1 Tax=Rattus norvegicus TaxID=10116 RepID=A6JCY9_RAT|nr:rCG57013 [Rattus norvegicus]
MGLLHIMCHMKQVILRSSTEVFFILNQRKQVWI